MTPAEAPALISVVIPAHDAARFLGECLASVFSQQGRFELEVIVVDDGSTDETVSIARGFAGVTLIGLETNQGPAVARNAGIAQARGEFVAFLDADDLWPADSLAARIDVLQRHPAAALVFGDCRQFDAQARRAQTLFEEGGFGATAWGPGELAPHAYERLLDDNFITTGSVLARRSLLVAAGGFAADLRLVEDLDLWLRLSRRHPLGWHSAVCLLRRRHDANQSRDARAMSLAYLEVLRRQDLGANRTPPELARKLKKCAAREQLLLAERALNQRDFAEATRWARRSLLTRPGAKALWRITQAAMAARCGASAADPAPPPR